VDIDGAASRRGAPARLWSTALEKRGRTGRGSGDRGRV
jgi:hypothetical protein